jgi:hypothetical protein
MMKSFCNNSGLNAFNSFFNISNSFLWSFESAGIKKSKSRKIPREQQALAWRTKRSPWVQAGLLRCLDPTTKVEKRESRRKIQILGGLSSNQRNIETILSNNQPRHTQALDLHACPIPSSLHSLNRISPTRK